MEKNQLPCEVDFSTTSFRVQAHKLPMEYLSKENAKIIGNGMGKFLDVDLGGADKAKWGNFLRIKVEIKSTAPFFKGFWPDKAPLADLWVQMKYERLLDFCYGCGRLEHMKRDCKWGKERQEGVVTRDKFFKGYGPWLIAEPITRKSNRASDLMFLDVIQAHETEKLGTKEGTSSMVEEKGREYLGQVENEYVE